VLDCGHHRDGGIAHCGKPCRWKTEEESVFAVFDDRSKLLAKPSR